MLLTFLCNVLNSKFVFFSYRTHPDNINCLTAANIHHVSLANNHTLDFQIKGLEETCETLDKAGISYVGQ
jgi:poly-gamma-glutamate synthesis protein (capsule biosynthesis protein)